MFFSFYFCLLLMLRWCEQHELSPTSHNLLIKLILTHHTVARIKMLDTRAWCKIPIFPAMYMYIKKPHLYIQKAAAKWLKLCQIDIYTGRNFMGVRQWSWQWQIALTGDRCKQEIVADIFLINNNNTSIYDRWAINFTTNSTNSRVLTWSENFFWVLAKMENNNCGLWACLRSEASGSRNRTMPYLQNKIADRWDAKSAMSNIEWDFVWNNIIIVCY